MKAITLYGLKQLATLASGLGKKKKLFILIYHRVLDEPDFMRPSEVDKIKFGWQMELLSKYFNVLSMSDALEKIQKNSLPPRAVCITFDDGYADNYHNALPILKNNQLTATFFISSGYLNGGRMWNDTIIETLRNYPEQQLNLKKINLGVYKTATKMEKKKAANDIIQKIKYANAFQREEYANYIQDTFSSNLPNDLMLTDRQLVKLHQNSMEIGGHTVSHPIMAKLEKQAVQREVRENKEKLEQLIDSSIRFFAYPNGRPNIDYKFEQIQQIKNMGYKAAVSTQWGVVEKPFDLYQLPRFTPWDTNPVKFMLRLIIMYYGTGTGK